MHKRFPLAFCIGLIIVASLYLLFAWILKVTPIFYLLTFAIFAAFFTLRLKVDPRGWNKPVAWLLLIAVLIPVANVTRKNKDVSFFGNTENGIIRTVMQYSGVSMTNILEQGVKEAAEPYKFESWEVPEGYKNKEIKLRNSRGYLLTKNSNKSKRIIYQIHGGGYIAGFMNQYNDMAVKYSKAYQDAAVFSLDYRTASTAVFPAALDDSLDGYQWLLDQGYTASDIIVCGDSAGGGLSLAMTLKLRDEGKEVPKALVLSSPWADLTATGASYKTKIHVDAFFGTRPGKKAPRYPVPVAYAGDGDKSNPYISPIYGDYKGMPPMLIQTGGDELLLSDSKTIVNKAKKAGIEVKFIEYPGMFHTFYIIAPTIPEGQAAWKQIDQFIEDVANNNL